MEHPVQRTRYKEQEHFEPWKRACERRPDLDRFCSSPLWGVPLNEAFSGSIPIYVYTDLGAPGELAFFTERRVRGGVLVMPVDGMWLLGTPILSPDPQAFLSRLVKYWAHHPVEGVRQVMVSGLYPENPLNGSEVWSRLHAWNAEPSGRMVASLEGGLDGFMGRRSKNFRSRLRRTVKAASRDGFEVEYMPETLTQDASRELMHRVFSIEERSWKGQAGRGIDSGGMRRFYELMVPRLAAEGRLRGVFLTREGRDAAYLFGAFFDRYFRGLQFSYQAEEDLGLGNVCQYHMIERLVEEGCTHYDLGQAMKYKSRWAEEEIQSFTHVFQI
ncbi:MAG: GNAT family N-acetyltransferase [Candidatus Eremiobacteraeota bacterium]|nr:GNAT family N-acetyltransferase [Candidatus Eremiobacteraeota bacterium]